MNRVPRKPSGGIKNKLGYKNINYLTNKTKTTEWFIVNFTRYKNRYIKSFESLEEAIFVRNNMYSMFNLTLPKDDLIKFKEFEERFLKNKNFNYNYSDFIEIKKIESMYHNFKKDNIIKYGHEGLL